MPNAASTVTARAALRTGLALFIGLAMAGVALAAPNNGGGGGTASTEDCQRQADIDFAVAMANCSMYASQPGGVGLCQSDAIMAHFLAMQACSGDAAFHGNAGTLGIGGGGLTVSNPGVGGNGFGGITKFHGGLRTGNTGSTGTSVGSAPSHGNVKFLGVATFGHGLRAR